MHKCINIWLIQKAYRVLFTLLLFFYLVLENKQTLLYYYRQYKTKDTKKKPTDYPNRTRTKRSNQVIYIIICVSFSCVSSTHLFLDRYMCV